jgi:hypothetical protein
MSPDGSTLLASAGTGSLVTTAGTWTFGGPGATGNAILLNGQAAAGGLAVSLQVANQGKMYALANNNTWWAWANGGWVGTAAPIVVPPPPPVVTIVAASYAAGVVAITFSDGHVVRLTDA